jgi:hypothetical protein
MSQDGLRILEDMRTRGLNASTGIYNALIGVCARCKGGLTLARQTLQQMQQDGIARDEMTYLAVLEAAQRSATRSEASPDDAWHVLHTMDLDGVKPGVRAYAALMSVYAKAAAAGADVGLEDAAVGLCALISFLTCVCVCVCVCCLQLMCVRGI